MKFKELEMNSLTLKAIDDMGFENMTEIQERAIPLLLDGNDIIGKSQTGTGKTMAFAIPAIENIDETIKKPQVLVLLPTRELALQVAEEFQKVLKYSKEIKVVPVFGGASIEKQIRDLKRGANIVVGTPGRIMDHMRRKTLKFNDLKMVVLDEADEMLNMGFREDIELILDAVQHDIQIALFSATMPKPIIHIAEHYQHNPSKVEIEPKNLVNPDIQQKYYNIADHHKFEALTRLLEVYTPKRALIFCNTKHLVDEITNNLQELGYSSDKIHGDMRQISRLAVLKRFTEGRLSLLVATDVAARGIDVDDIDIVFNYDVPENEEYYVHRIGRTGRAGKSGLSLTLARSRDQFKLRQITKYTKKDIEKGEIPNSKIINDIKIEHFKEDFNQLTLHKQEEQLNPYLKIVENLQEKGYDPAYIAAILIQRQLPLTEAADLNADFTKKNRKQPQRGKARRDGRDDRSNPQDTKRLFLNIGTKDKVQKRDILGAICGESGISSAQVGQIDMYNKFTFVDIDEAVVKKVEKKLDGKKIKDRKINVEISKKRKKKRRK